ncbi:MAG TPA: PqqD family protein [Acidimicrobiia bacterium]|nr:PqqD family protein [Acidimicrobiia bacterium]
MNPLNDQSTPRRSDDATAEASPTGAVLQKAKDSNKFELNASAFAIWNLCDGKTTLAEMADAIGVLTGATTAETLSEVARTVAEFYRVGLATELATASNGSTDPLPAL